MTRNFASLALARLYEKQGYVKDALDMYRALDTSRYPDTNDISDAVSRLQASVAQMPLSVIEQEKTNSITGRVEHETASSELNQGRTDVIMPDLSDSSKEVRVAALLEKWLMLLIMQKRVDVFKNIKSRL